MTKITKMTKMTKLIAEVIADPPSVLPISPPSALNPFMPGPPAHGHHYAVRNTTSPLLTPADFIEHYEEAAKHRIGWGREIDT